MPTTPSMKRKQKTREMECSSKCYRRERLLKTPLKVVIDENFYGKARQKITIQKTCPKKRQHFFFKENRTEFFVQKYHAKLPSKTLAKFCSQRKTVMKYSSWNFLYGKVAQNTVDSIWTLLWKVPYKKLPITPSNLIFEKRQYLSARLKKLFRNAAWNTVVNGFRKKDLSKNSSKSTN